MDFVGLLVFVGLLDFVGFLVGFVGVMNSVCDVGAFSVTSRVDSDASVGALVSTSVGESLVTSVWTLLEGSLLSHVVDSGLFVVIGSVSVSVRGLFVEVWMGVAVEVTFDVERVGRVGHVGRDGHDGKVGHVGIKTLPYQFNKNENTSH